MIQVLSEVVQQAGLVDTHETKMLGGEAGGAVKLPATFYQARAEATCMPGCGSDGLYRHLLPPAISL